MSGILPIRLSDSVGSFSKSYNSLVLLYSFRINFHFEVLIDLVLGSFGGFFHQMK